MHEQDKRRLIDMLQYALFGSGGFAILFLLGYWHLSLYFGSLGTLFPIYELNAIFIAQIGFYQLMTVWIFLVILLFFRKKFWKTWLFILVTVLSFLFSFFISQCLASSGKSFQATWISFMLGGNDIPNVELLYSVPLSVNQLPVTGDLQQVVSDVESDDVKLQDQVFTDSLGIPHYVGPFKLLFESSDNYYLRSEIGYCELYGLLSKELLVKRNLEIPINAILLRNESDISPYITALSIDNSPNEIVSFLKDNPDFVMPAQGNLDKSLKGAFILEGSLNNDSSINVNGIRFSSTNFQTPSNYTNDPWNVSNNKGQENKEYQDKRQCKLIVLPKKHVESIKYYN